MKTYLYPVVIERNIFTIPDFDIVITDNFDISNAYSFATKLINKHGNKILMEGGELPKPSEVIPKGGETVLYIEFKVSLDALKLKYPDSVKKTLTIPEWMNREGNRLHLNFSKILQEALEEKIEESYN